MSPPPPIPLEEAQRLLLEMAPAPRPETVDLAGAEGRYLVEPLVARRTQPAHDLSAMDGYAMPGGETGGPWRIVGESAAGHPFERSLGPGEAVRISTGAAMPEGAGAILLQENAARDGDRLDLADGDPTPRHIRRAGFDFREGQELLSAGSRIGPAQVALGFSGGHGTVTVGKRPRVAVLDSGDELTADPAACGPHQIPASNGAMLAGMVAPLAGNVARIGPVSDRMDAMLAALDEAREADVLVTSGGASVGDHDLLRPALEQWGAQIDFWRVAMKPGKPLLVARRGEQLILGLPGNPVSSFVTAYLLLLPLLRAMAGARHPLPAVFSLPSLSDLPAGGSRMEFVRARLVGSRVERLETQDSSALAALAASDALIRRPVDCPAAQTRDMVEIHLLGENGGIA